jgi:hypothetical protein
MECIGAAEGTEYALAAAGYVPCIARTGNRRMDDFHRRAKAALAFRRGPGRKTDEEDQVRENFAH